MLITIEGIDGSGKSSLLEGLKSALADLDPLFTREPGSGWLGDVVRRGIAEEIDPVAEALLFVADHALHLETVIRPAHANDRLVISDRYSDSRYAYQAVTLDGIIPDPLAWLRQVHGEWTIRPDLTFLLVVPVAEAVRRLSGAKRPEHFERAEVLERVQEVYLDLVCGDPERFVIVDGMMPEEEVRDFVAGEIRTSAALSRSHLPRSR
ncbi:MAG: dTMP kinase [Methanomicrobiaceae archaeon]|nr:dTMP kinase [Methanomicrobiaceae archaeon]